LQKLFSKTSNSLAADSDIHPDAAVRQLEHIASLLRAIPGTELDRFFEHAAKRLEELRAAGAPKEQLDLLENLRGHLGI
jgi:hypothetical protein